jgi:hypothetical protein
MPRREDLAMRHFAAACLLVAAFAPLAALAGELDGYVPPEDGARSCWSRSYDAAHLADHPLQQVTKISFAVGYMAATIEFSEQYSFYLEARLRDGTEGYASGPCHAQDGKMWCGVECDGGGVLLERRADGKVLVDLKAHGYIHMSGGCGGGEGDGFSLEAGKDDHEFLLHAETPKTCKSAILE